MTIDIPNEVIRANNLRPQDLQIDFAVFLYEKKILSIGQAKKVARLNLLDFQQELSKRDVFIHYEVEDIEKDLQNLQSL